MRIPDHTLNRLRLLKTIRHDGPINRSLLPARTGLSAGTVTNLTANLLKRGLVVEHREEEPVRGRPRALLSIDRDGGVVLGVSQLGEGRLQLAFVDLAGNLLHDVETPLAGRGTLESFAADLGHAIRAEVAASRFPFATIRRIGIALPAVVDTRRGEVHFMMTFPLGPVPVAAIIEDIVGIPVTIENDMANMARAEHWFGRAQRFDDFALVQFDLALASARYLEGLPLMGANGVNPDLCHTKIAMGDDARPCFCGGKGCATMYGSIVGVLAALNLLDGFASFAVDRLYASFDSVVARAEAGDAAALNALRDAARHFAVIVANQINAADPGVILAILPGERLQPLIADAFAEALAANVMPGMRASTQVEMATKDPNWRWKGTAALALEREYLAPD